VPTEAARRHILTNYQPSIERALLALDRPDVRVRFVVTGDYEEDET
jgi:hypothetical protein